MIEITNKDFCGCGHIKEDHSSYIPGNPCLVHICGCKHYIPETKEQEMKRTGEALCQGGFWRE